MKRYERNYGLKRIFKVLLYWFLRYFPLLKGEFRARLFGLSGAVVGKRVFIGHNVYLDNLHPELISIGDDVIITDGCKLITHFIDISFKDNHHQYTGNLVIGNGVFVGFNTVFVNSVIVGDNAVIAAGSVVTKDIPKNEVWGGVPARFIKMRFNV